MADIAYKRGDTVPIEAKLPADISDATSVDFHLYGGSEEMIGGAATVVDAPNGVVAYQFQDGETDIHGKFAVEWQVNYEDGVEETFPKDGRDVMFVYE